MCEIESIDIVGMDILRLDNKTVMVDHEYLVEIDSGDYIAFRTVENNDFCDCGCDLWVRNTCATNKSKWSCVGLMFKAIL